MVQANVGPVLSRALDVLDGWLTPRADAVLAVGERLAARHRALGGRVWIVPNAQALPTDNGTGSARALIREGLGMPDDALLVVYVGYLTPDRLLAPLLDAVCALPDVWLLIGGVGPQADLVASYAARCPRIQALGWVPVDDVVQSCHRRMWCIMASTRRTPIASTSCRIWRSLRWRPAARC